MVHTGSAGRSIVQIHILIPLLSHKQGTEITAVLFIPIRIPIRKPIIITNLPLLPQRLYRIQQITQRFQLLSTKKQPNPRVGKQRLQVSFLKPGKGRKKPSINFRKINLPLFFKQIPTPTLQFGNNRKKAFLKALLTNPAADFFHSKRTLAGQ